VLLCFQKFFKPKISEKNILVNFMINFEKSDLNKIKIPKRKLQEPFEGI